MHARALTLLLALAACARQNPPDRLDDAPHPHPSSTSRGPDLSPDALAHSIYKELIELDTSPPNGSTPAAAAMAARLHAARFPAADVHLLGPSPTKMNLVFRLRGTGARRPILLLAHLDVVEAKKEDWQTDPFKLVEKDGYYYGRGVLDDKAQAMIWLTTVLRIAREGNKPDRDIIVALTADEEEGDENGVDWLLREHKGLIDAAYALNEGGGGEIRAGRHVANEVQLGEKTEMRVILRTKDRGGLSAEPRRGENPIYRLSAALSRLEALEFPARLDEVTRRYFAAVATLESGALADDMRAIAKEKTDAAALARVAAASPWYASLMRTTCVATLVEGGVAPGALPPAAQATVDCRVLPNDSPEDTFRAIVAAVADPKITVVLEVKPTPAPMSPLLPEVMDAVGRIMKEMWPGVVLVPTILPGATDGKYLRAAGIPTYGVSGLFYDIDDEREHGNDERLGIKELEDGREFGYRLVKALSGL